MLSDAEPMRQSLLGWMFMALGLPYTIILAVAGLLCFLLALAVVLRGNGPMAAASLILIVHVPLLIGVFAAIQGGIASYTVIAMGAGTPRPADVAAGISTSLVAPMVGMLFMIPGYATAAIGALIRSLATSADEGEGGHVKK